jgi:NTE family protein
MFRKLNRKTREGLVNWGYAICDAALRKFVDPSLPRPDSLPFPKTRLT